MTAAAKRYGGSLFELAAEEHLDDCILQELDTAAACIAAEPAYLRLLSLPSIPRAQRRALLDEAFGPQMHPYTVNFLKLLCDDGLIRQLPACARGVPCPLQPGPRYSGGARRRSGAAGRGNPPPAVRPAVRRHRPAD